MNTKNTSGVVGRYAGSIALFISAMAVIPSSGPFTGAVYLLVLTIPFAFIAFFSGAWRTATGAMYFSLCYLLVSPMIWNPTIRVDLILAGLILVGLIMNIVMFWNYQKTAK